MAQRDVAADRDESRSQVYGITRAGQRGLEKETERWMRLAGLVNKLLTNESW